MDCFSLSEDGKTLIKYEGNESYLDIPEGVEIIQSKAFNQCDNLITVKLPSTIKLINKLAFNKCINLSLVDFPKNSSCECTGCSFCSCPKLDYAIIIGDKLIHVPQTFEGKYCIPQSIEVISGGAFCGCKKIAYISIPNGVKKIEEKAINECHSLKEILIPASVEKLEEAAIIDCISLEKLSVESSNVFYDSREDCNAIIDTKLNSILFGCCNTCFPKSITRIGEYAFAYSSSLRKLTIPVNIKGISSSAFEGCKNIERVIFEEGHTRPFWGAFADSEKIEEILIPDSYEPEFSRIIDFNDPEQLTELQIENSYSERIQEVIKKPIRNNHIIISVPHSTKGEFVVPDGITDIEERAFMNCKEITKVILPNSIKEIGSYAFTGCEKLAYINMPNNIIIHSPIFDDCFSLNLSIAIGNKLIRVSPQAKGYIIGSNISIIEQSAFQKCTKIKSIIIPDGVGLIGNKAFMDCENLEEITIPNSVSSIGYQAFSGCQSVRQLRIPSDVKSIGFNAFSNCISLEEIKLSHGLTEIAYSSFDGCSSLEKVEIPSTVKKISDRAFVNCSNLKFIFIPKSIEEIGCSAFENCHSLEAIVFENNSSLSKLGNSAFKGCKSLKKFIIPDGVKEIGKETFADCIALEEITIPNTVKSINTSAFSGTKIIRVNMSSSWDAKRDKLNLPPAPSRYIPSCERQVNDLLGFKYDDMVYTHGRISPCPYCGNRGTSTYIDGTAQCDKCHQWFRYL